MKAIKELQLPQVKQVYPALLSNQIVGVQPMQGSATIGGWFYPLRGTSIRDARACYGPIGQKGVLITDALIKDILNNIEKLESLPWDIPEINITLKSIPITSQARKLNITPPNLTTFGVD